MVLFEDMATDMDFSRPKVYISETQIILENVSNIISLSDSQITVSSGNRRRMRYTSVSGENFFIKEISDGRILIEGQIQRVEFLQP